MRYDVVVVGFRLNATLKPAEALHKVLGLDLDTCKVLTRQFPATVLTGLSESRADKVAEQLTQAGAKVEVQESRLSQVERSQSHSGRPFPADEQSGNYAIGEILAPMPKNKASVPPGQPQAKRPSREELDEALRDSFRPQQSPGEAPLPEVDLNVGAEHDAAFAGLHNFGENLDGFNDTSAALDVEEAAMRSIQRKPEAAASPRAVKRISFWKRLARLLSDMVSTSSEWAIAVFWLSIIAAITLLAVGYALDPNDAVGALHLGELPAQARKAASTLSGK